MVEELRLALDFAAGVYSVQAHVRAAEEPCRQTASLATQAACGLESSARLGAAAARLSAEEVKHRRSQILGCMAAGEEGDYSRLVQFDVGDQFEQGKWA